MPVQVGVGERVKLIAAAVDAGDFIVLNVTAAIDAGDFMEKCSKCNELTLILLLETLKRLLVLQLSFKYDGNSI